MHPDALSACAPLGRPGGRPFADLAASRSRPWSNGVVHTERGFDRLVNFSDAVVAIAITLIVLPLVDAARDIGGKTAGEFLLENSASLYSAALSFVVIGTFWRNHHASFERMTGYSPWVLRLNFVWLAGMVFLPLPTVLLVTTSSRQTAAPLLYIGTMFVSLIAHALIATVARHDGLLKEDAPDSTVVQRWSAVVLMGVAFVITAVVPGAFLWPLLLLLLETPIARVVKRRGRNRPAAG